MPCVEYEEMDLNKKKSVWVRKICISTNSGKVVFDGEIDLNNKELVNLLKKYCKKKIRQIKKGGLNEV